MRASSAVRGLPAADAQRKHSHRGDDEDIILVRFTEGKGKENKNEKGSRRRADSKAPLTLHFRCLSFFLSFHSDMEWGKRWALVGDRWDFGIISFRSVKEGEGGGAEPVGDEFY